MFFNSRFQSSILLILASFLGGLFIELSYDVLSQNWKEIVAYTSKPVVGLTLTSLLLLLVYFLWAVLAARFRAKYFFDKVERNKWYSDTIFYLDEADLSRVSSKLGKITIKRPVIVLQLRMKPYLHWVEAAYVGFIKKLSPAFFRRVIIIHDYEYEIEGSGITRILEPDEYSAELKHFKKCIRSIPGNNITILPARSFFSEKKAGRFLVDKFYSHIIPVMSHTKVTERLDFIDQIRFFVGILATLFFVRSSYTLSMVWEKRRDWIFDWSKKVNINNLDFVFGRTLSFYGKTYAIEKSETALVLDEAPSVFCRKLDQLTVHEKELIATTLCRSLSANEQKNQSHVV